MNSIRNTHESNLPSTLQFTNGNRTDYVYSADGVKRKVTHQTAIASVSVPMGQITNLTSAQVSQTNTIDYCGNVIYENGNLSKILMEEGYITLSGSTPTYHYYLKDHLGNNRVVMNQSGTVEQVNHYYPFGGLFGEGVASTSQPYKYNGKELDRMHGLDWYDYGNRFQDGALGRFSTMDRFAEKYYSLSPYQYGANNPANCIDINGDSLLITGAESIIAIYNGLKEGSRIKMQFNNGVLIPSSIEKEAQNTTDPFLQDLYEIAVNETNVELSLSETNMYAKDGKIISENFGIPYDDNDEALINREELQNMGIPIGKHIQGNLGQTLVADKLLPSEKKSTNNNVQIIINSNGSINQRTVGLAHEFGHVILYLRNKPFSHTQPGVDTFVYKKATMMSKRLGYDY